MFSDQLTSYHDVDDGYNPYIIVIGADSWGLTDSGLFRQSDDLADNVWILICSPR